MDNNQEYSTKHLPYMLLGHRYCSFGVDDTMPTPQSYLECRERGEDMYENEDPLDPQVMVAMATEGG